MRLLTRWWFLSVFLLASTACVTVNIYFPEAATEEAAREIVRQVLEQDQAPAPEPQGDQGSYRPDQTSIYYAWAGAILERLIPAAQAAQPDININTPAIKSIRKSLEQRQRQLVKHYRSGAIGFAKDGDIAIRDAKALSLKDRKTVNGLVQADNADRAALYREIARANGNPGWESKVRATFAKVWVQEAPKGYWYQAGNGWKKK